MRNLVGQTLGQYKILERIGAGGMATVYKASQESLQREIALKVLHATYADEKQFVQRFLQEARSAAKMDHPNIVTIYEAGEAKGFYYIAMPYIQGATLGYVLKQTNPDNIGWLLQAILQMASALDYAHQHGIIHRDVKPGNILVNSDGRALLTDFGIAKAMTSSANLTQTGTLLGTPHYMAPEQIRGQPPRPQTDQYAMAIIAYEGLAGRRPFQAEEAQAILFKHIEEAPDLTRIPPPCRDALRKGLAKDPNERFQTVSEFAYALQQGVTGVMMHAPPVATPAAYQTPRPITAPTGPLPSGTTSAQRSLPRWVWGGLALIVMALIAGGVFLVLSSGSERSLAVTNTEIPTLTTASGVTAEATEASVNGNNVFRSATETSQAATSIVQAATGTALSRAIATNQAAAQPSNGAQEVEVATTEPTNTSTPLPTATPQPPTATPIPVATNTSTSTPLPPTPAPPTLTPTPTDTPTPRGPTPIPVTFVDTVDGFGRVEITDVDLNPANPQEVYVLVKGDGIYKSFDSGEGSWGRIDLNGAGITGLVMAPNNPAVIYAGTWNAVLKSVDGGNTWRAYGGGLSTANRSVDVLVPHPTDPNIIYGGIGASLVVSTDGGQNWQSDFYGNGLQAGGRLTSIAFSTGNPNTMLVGGEFGSFYKSVDAGRTFQQLAYSVGSGTYSIVAHPSRTDVFLAGINSNSAAIVRTTNAADFISSSNGLIFGGADSAYSAITYAPSNSEIIYVGSGYENDAYAKGIFKSIDGGDSWNGISAGLNVNAATGLPHYVKSIVVHPTNPNIVFAATGGGLFKSTNGGQTWVIQ